MITNQNIESKLIEDMKTEDMSPSFNRPPKSSMDQEEAIKSIELEIDSLVDDEIDEWTSTFLKVGKEYFDPEVYDETSMILESKLGMNIQDWMLTKLREEV